MARTLILFLLAFPAAQALGQPAPVTINDLLEVVRKSHRMPALAAAVVTSKGLVAQGAVGVRKAGTDVKATVDDKWHLGSETKAMTATMIGTLEEQGRLKWENTITDAFPELAAAFPPVMRKATLVHLLSHRAGLMENIAWGQIAQTGTTRDQRAAVLKITATTPLRSNPGAGYVYSNLGYVVAGAMAERAANAAWEDLMVRQLFEPLRMTSAGFGGTGTPGKIDQPWPHHEGGRPASTNGPKADNPPVMGPAGTVHSTMADWGKFITDQLKGARGERALLRPYTYKKLHTPPADDYALGWIVTQRDWGGGTVLTHAGSNTLNYCVVWMAPRVDFAVLVCTNQGGSAAAKAVDEAAWTLIRHYLR
jgi:CubicO group peptidase (beta-lactamase class C family)